MNVMLVVAVAILHQSGDVRVELKPIAQAPGGSKRAVILAHGLRFGASGTEVDEPRFENWQESDSRLVGHLRASVDVYSLGYGQGRALTEISRSPRMLASLMQSCDKYPEVILVGHSAGGLLLRYVLEDNSKLRVNRLVQICCPNGGCPSADRFPVDPKHRAFVQSLSPAAMKTRNSLPLPGRFEHVCIVSEVFRKGDLVIPSRLQLPLDLHGHGVHVIRVDEPHFSIMASSRGTRKVAEAVLTSNVSSSEVANR